VKPFIAPRARAALMGVAVLAALLGLCGLLWPESPAAEPSAALAAPARALREPFAASVSPALERAADDIPIMPAGAAEAPTEEPRHPHPHTPIHDRIYRENTLYGQLNGAMDVKDVQGMRRLLAEYRDEYPEDAHFLQEGYTVIADCLERPGDEAARTAGERYWHERRASILRRYVRRHCLEAPP
jgi:hypothetical protein